MIKKVIIVGAGPGGLTCGMLLAEQGCDVTLIEKESKVGGRNGSISEDGFTFDIGPTFLLMKELLEEIFINTKRKLSDYITLQHLDPMYKLSFADKEIHLSTDKQFMKSQLEKHFPGSYNGYLRFLENEKLKYDRLIQCLQIPYGRLTDYLTPRVLRSIPVLDAHVSLYDVLSRYFYEKDLRTCFTFQAKYIGMSPWQAPGLFSIISFMEHYQGIYHVEGGLNKISEAMAKVITEEGGNIMLNSEVKEIIIDEKKAKGVILKNGDVIHADYIVLNSDFAYSMSKLVPPEKRKKYTDKKLDSMKYSCSTFMLYLGLDKIYDKLEHHNIFFAENYQQNVTEITGNILSESPSFYIQNASVTDKTLAPEGKSTLYVLVPVPNNNAGLDWKSIKTDYRNKIINLLESRAGLADIRNHIEFEKIISPADWENRINVHKAATFNLAHNIGQMLYFRPHNKFEEFENCYLVGGGTHPGSGLPTIYESGKISAELILQDNPKKKPSIRKRVKEYIVR